MVCFANVQSVDRILYSIFPGSMRNGARHLTTRATLILFLTSRYYRVNFPTVWPRLFGRFLLISSASSARSYFGDHGAQLRRGNAGE